MPDISDTIEETALTGISSASVDGRSATATPIKDLIEADKYLTNKAALEGTNAYAGPVSAWGRTRMAKVVPPGAS